LRPSRTHFEESEYHPSENLSGSRQLHAIWFTDDRENGVRYVTCQKKIGIEAGEYVKKTKKELEHLKELEERGIGVEEVVAIMQQKAQQRLKVV
jgi:hypothetical protein